MVRATRRAAYSCARRAGSGSPAAGSESEEDDDGEDEGEEEEDDEDERRLEDFFRFFFLLDLEDSFSRLSFSFFFFRLLESLSPVFLFLVCLLFFSFFGLAFFSRDAPPVDSGLRERLLLGPLSAVAVPLLELSLQPALIAVATLLLLQRGGCGLRLRLREDWDRRLRRRRRRSGEWPSLERLRLRLRLFESTDRRWWRELRLRSRR